jgi:hypothetical protein
MNKHTQVYLQELNKKAFVDLSAIGKSIADYRPTNPHDALTKGAPVAAGIGAIAGATNAAMGPDEYDSRTGERKSKIKKAIRDAIIGAGIGATAAVASPTLIRGGYNVAGNVAMDQAKSTRKSNPQLSKKLLNSAFGSKFMSSPFSEGLSLSNIVDAYSS